MPFCLLPKNHSSKSVKSHASVITCVHIILKKSKKSIPRFIHIDLIIDLIDDLINWFNIGLLNPWSVCNKANSIHDFIVDHKLDALALTETWLKGDERDNVTIQELLPPGYKICQQARANRGGGVAIIYHSRLNIQNTPALHQYTSFEAIECDIVSSQPVKLIVLYKPPPSPNNGLTHNLFITQFTDYLELYIATTKQLVLLGDFNIHINKTDDRDAVEFNNLLDQFGLVQHVCDATHRGGDTPSTLSSLDHRTQLYKTPMLKTTVSLIITLFSCAC